MQKNDAQQGPYTLNEIRTRIENGALILDDWGWNAELSDWVRLSTFFDDAVEPGPGPFCYASEPKKIDLTEPLRPSAGHQEIQHEYNSNDFCKRCGWLREFIERTGRLCKDPTQAAIQNAHAVARSEAPSGLARCRVCGKDVSPSAQTCPHCGEHSPAITNPKRCPKCCSTCITVSTASRFGLGKAAAGVAILGPLGLLAGLLPTTSTCFKCLDCGAEFM